MKIIKALAEGIAIDRHSNAVELGTLKGIDMPNDTLQRTYNSYLEAYNDIAANERERLLRLSVTDDIVSSNPNGESCGLVSLMEHIEQFKKEKPGASFKSNKLLAHHGQFLSEWTMFSKDGAALATAHSYGRFNEQGLIS